MLVLSRVVGESVVIGDHCIVTVVAIRGIWADICITVHASPTERRTSSLGRNDRMDVQEEVAIVLVDLRPDFVRIGVEAPRTMKVRRFEIEP